MKKLLLTTILLFFSISFYGDNLQEAKKILSQKVEIEKAEVKVSKLKVKSDKSNSVFLSELKAHQAAYKQAKKDLKVVKKTIKAKKAYDKAEKTYKKQSEEVATILTKYVL